MNKPVNFKSQLLLDDHPKYQLEGYRKWSEEQAMHELALFVARECVTKTERFVYQSHLFGKSATEILERRDDQTMLKRGFIFSHTELTFNLTAIPKDIKNEK